MRLVACQRCHMQYDVTEVAGEKFRCRCGEMLANPPAAYVVDVRIERCGSCGARVSPDVDCCEFCSSEIVRDVEKLSRICPECHCRNGEESRFCTACGVGFAPVPVESEACELPCPVCGVLMPPRSIGGIGINECGACNGIWTPEDRLDQLIQRALDADRQSRALPAQGPCPRVKGANPASQRVAYRKCPVCEAFMQRRNFRKTSGVIVDCCKKHGTWLEADELEQITGFVLAGGNPAAEAVLEQAGQGAGFGRDPADNVWGRPLARPTGLAGACAESFVSLFKAILD